MGDTRIEALERRWEETGLPEDEAAYLMARMRAGTLSEERFELALYLGSAGALLAADQLEWKLPPGSTTLGSVMDWAKGLGKFGVECCVRAGLALGRDFVARDDTKLPSDREVVAAVEAWVEAPSAEQAGVCAQLVAPRNNRFYPGAMWARYLGELPAHLYEEGGPNLRMAGMQVYRIAGKSAVAAPPSTRVRERIAADLVPWLLHEEA